MTLKKSTETKPKAKTKVLDYGTPEATAKAIAMTPGQKMIKFKEHLQNQDLLYHAENDIPLGELYRVGSQSYYRVFREARELYSDGKVELSGLNLHLIENTDIGEFGQYEGNPVPLDSPMVMESEYDGRDVELNKPKKGGPKKYYVYVKDPSTGNIKKVTWGDTTGLKVKLNDKGARASFAARHKCDTRKDRTKASYWACNLPRYAKQLGLSGGGNFFW